jgi:hypothetical protein
MLIDWGRSESDEDAGFSSFDGQTRREDLERALLTYFIMDYTPLVSEEPWLQQLAPGVRAEALLRQSRTAWVLKEAEAGHHHDGVRTLARDLFVRPEPKAPFPVFAATPALYAAFDDEPPA